VTGLVWLNVTIPLGRRTLDGGKETIDVKLRIPAADPRSAENAATDIGYAIVDNLPQVGDGNRHGWKSAGHVTEISEAKP
jgi:hypothetical protein